MIAAERYSRYGVGRSYLYLVADALKGQALPRTLMVSGVRQFARSPALTQSESMHGFKNRSGGIKQTVQENTDVRWYMTGTNAFCYMACRPDNIVYQYGLCAYRHSALPFEALRSCLDAENSPSIAKSVRGCV